MQQEPRTTDGHLLLLHERKSLCFSVAYHECEVRIWGEYDRYTYEILAAGIVIARGTAENEFEALERTIPLFNLLNHSSSAHSAPWLAIDNSPPESVRADTLRFKTASAGS